MTLTTINSSALIGGAPLSNKNNGDKMAAKKKYLNVSEFPYVIDGGPVLPGEFFDSEPTVNILQLIGAEAPRAVEVTKENEKSLNEQAPKIKAAYLERTTPKKAEVKK